MYLTGENIRPTTAKAARALIGKRVQYLCKADIDRSGRGYFFPRSGTIVDVYRKEIATDHIHNFCIDLSTLVEMVLIGESPSIQNNDGEN